MHNQITFNSEGSRENAFKKESVLKWFSFQSEVVVDQTFEITRAEAEL